MGDLGNAKTFGGIGAVLILIGMFTVPIISIVGLLLTYIGVKNIAESVKDQAITDNFKMSIILGIIALVALFIWPVIVFGGLGLSFTSFDFTGDPIAMFESVFVACLVTFIIMFIFFILHAMYLKKSFDSIATKINVNLFRTTGLVYFIGAILIIIGIGFIILFIAIIMMIIAFFSIPNVMQPTGGAISQQPGPAYPQQPQQPQQTGRICPACGRPIPMDAQVCPYCGKDFRQQ